MWLTSINLIGLLIICFIEYVKHRKKLKGLSKDETKIRNRKEMCEFLGIFLMLIVAGYITSKSLIIMVISSIGFLAYCFIHFLTIIYSGLKKNSEKENIKIKEIIFAQFASLCLLSVVDNFNSCIDLIGNDISKQIIIVFLLTIKYGVNIFFIINDIHIVLLNLIKYVKNNNKLINKIKSIEKSIEGIFEFNPLNNGHERTYEKITSVKNIVLKNILKLIHFTAYIIVFSIMTFIFLFIIYPLSKVRDLILMIINSIKILVEKMWNKYTAKDLYRYFRMSIIFSMLIVFVIVNNDERIIEEVKNIYEFTVTVILIPIILESLLNLNNTKND